VVQFVSVERGGGPLRQRVFNDRLTTVNVG